MAGVDMDGAKDQKIFNAAVLLQGKCHYDTLGLMAAFVFSFRKILLVRSCIKAMKKQSVRLNCLRST